ncbi:phage portal protein [Edwardsiella piscicida]|uniref:phage portal protein n=1 Tax=Edwardsiella piscicida TaxID=1263550 RepID=UPI000D50B87A|nr:phage portal protein [Edwardsiella piscicida]UCQ40057.1 phage portal protein [Edwardsiella piscicida]
MFWKKKKEKPDKQIRKMIQGNSTLKNQINNTLRSGGVIGTGTDNINNLIHNQLRSLVSTSRKLSLENCIAKRYITAAADGVVGAEGIYIRPRIEIYDTVKNQQLSREIEKRFYQYADDRELFSNTGRLSIGNMMRLIEKTRATDGECFIRIHRENGLQFEIVDSMRIPSGTVPQMLENGNYISNGIEFNQYGKPQAYYVAPINISTMQYLQQCERVLATDILHYFIPQQPDQHRGLPDLLPCIDLIGSLEEFLNAAIIAKKISASAMAFVTNAPSNREYDEQEIIYQQTSLDPGSIVELREGQDLRTVNPQASTDGISDFINQQLQMISMSLNMSKQTLTGDTANASFSASKLAERVQMNTFKTRQSELISSVLKPIYIEFCKREFINMDVQISKFNELIKADYVPQQRAISIDPLKDLQTEVLALQNGLKSKSMVIAEMGYDPSIVLAEINREEESDNKNKDMNNENENDQGDPDTTNK